MKQTFDVYVEVFEVVTVDGRTPDEAADNARAHLHYKLLRGGFSMGDIVSDAGGLVQPSEAVGPARPDSRATTYACFHCGQASDKSLWGPGRITCPRCGLREPAPVEVDAFLADKEQGACCREARVMFEVSGATLAIGPNPPYDFGHGCRWRHWACPVHHARRFFPQPGAKT